MTGVLTCALPISLATENSATAAEAGTVHSHRLWSFFDAVAAAPADLDETKKKEAQTSKA